ncbi:MAG: helix-turn-helix transcriptional regulator [Tyzzerella sp.]|nr:helix-turn-helix transcriptional regulator [Tyzzerella sp.]
MEVLYCGYDFPHEKGEFCLRNIFSFYFISCFSTPFLYEVGGNFYKGNPGDFLITPPGCTVYHGPQNKDEAFANDWIYVMGEDIEELLRKYPLPQNTAFNIDNSNILKNCIKKIKDELMFKKTGYEEIISCCLTDTIINIHRLYQRQHHSDASFSRIESAREIFLRNLERDWTLQEMADLSGYSVSRFSTLYTRRFGHSPKADLIDNRIELAKQMLKYSELSITEIAKRCGFQSIYYFSKYFKANVGIAPSEYAKDVE